MDKKEKIDNKTDLEICILEKPIVLNWITYLVDTFAITILNFWIETQNLKYIDNQQVLEQEAFLIYNKYFSDKTPGINIDNQELLIDLKKRMVAPQKTSFMLIQNSIWNLLKHDLYTRFQISSKFKTKIDKKQLKYVVLKNNYTVDIYTKFLNNNKNRPTGYKFLPHVIPQSNMYELHKEHLHVVQIDIVNIWKDSDLFLAFREYLYQNYSEECLSFYMASRCYEMLPKKERIKQSEKIYELYISSNAPHEINIDFSIRNSIKKTYKKANKTLFNTAKDYIWKTLERNLFPSFLSSSLYSDCNKDTIKYVYTGKLTKSDTLSRYTEIYKRPIKNPYNITHEQLYRIDE
jgi:hypothetical protein